MTVNEIAEHIQADIIGDGGTTIHGIAKIEEAGPGQITFIANTKYLKYLETTSASAVIIGKSVEEHLLPDREGRPVLLRTADPYGAFLFVLELFSPPVPILQPGIHPTAIVPGNVKLGKDVAVGAHVVFGENCRIGDNTIIAHGTVLGDDVSVGADTVLYPNVSVGKGCIIGSDVIIHSGTVIGSDGFGFAPQKDGSYKKIPQTGIVVIEDNVEIGSNCSIDRATMGETRICRGAKLDNLIQVAHNVTIGPDTVIAAQTGISGSTKIGNRCIIAGQVGIVGHIEIAERVTLAAQSGISKSIKKPGTTYFGYPAKEHGRALRIEAIVRQLPELAKEVEELKKAIAKLQGENK